MPSDQRLSHQHISRTNPTLIKERSQRKAQRSVMDMCGHVCDADSEASRQCEREQPGLQMTEGSFGVSQLTVMCITAQFIEPQQGNISDH